MKKILSCLTVLGLALPLLVGCNKESAQAPTADNTAKKEGAPAKAEMAASKPLEASAEPNSFKEVTAQLDPGGSFYLYLGTEQWLNGLSGKVAEFRHFADAIPDVNDNDRENITKGVAVITNLIKDSGIEDVSGFGMSAIARETNFYHTKSILHHYKGKGSGFLWTMFGQKAHPLDGLDLLPTNTAAAFFTDADVPMVWSTIEKEVAQSGFPEAAEALKQLPEHFQAGTGLSWDKVLASLGGHFGVALTLDDSKKITLPLPNLPAPLEIATPGLMLVAKVNDSTIFDRVDKALTDMGQPITKTDEKDLKMRTVAIPLPLPVELRPTIAMADGYLFIATTDSLIQHALAVKAGKEPGLKTTAEFKKLSTDVPQQGNCFTFLSKGFGRAIMDAQRASITANPKTQWLESMMKSDKSGYVYSVSANTDEGWVCTGNGNQHPAKLLLIGAVVPAAVIAAVALPNFVKAKETSQKNVCINNLRQIENAKQMWALEKNKDASATPTRADLADYLKKFPVCPSGGHYTINAVNTKAECSHPGHQLP